ncbi:phage tail tube protein [Mesorhizobium sp. SB112]|uniref:phage tail tube protein n=1 Tax=Mesorhizobium sp. SB112 TaxID=3151853 RepID=UPI003262D42B
MGITTTARSKISIGTTAVATDAATFAADTYTVISHVEDVGEFGTETNVVEGNFVDQQFVRKLPGSRNSGTMNVVAAFDASDAGQIAAKAASETDFTYNIKVELDDKPAPGGTNSIFYFKAFVASAKVQGGGSDDITKINFALAIDGAILEIPAATA